MDTLLGFKEASRANVERRSHGEVPSVAWSMSYRNWPQQAFSVHTVGFLISGKRGVPINHCLANIWGSVYPQIVFEVTQAKTPPDENHLLNPNQWYHFGAGAPAILVYFSGWIGMFTGSPFEGGVPPHCKSPNTLNGSECGATFWGVNFKGTPPQASSCHALFVE